MDLNSIYAALAGTLATDQAARQAAEDALKSLERVPGYFSSLFQVVNSKEAPLEVRQAGIIYFKNLVNKHWERENPTQDEATNWVIAEQDRQFVRQNLLEALVQAHPLCRSQVAESLRKISSLDFPEKLPGFLEQVAARLDASLPPDEIHGALIAIRVLTKNYEYRSSERRKGVNEILIACFPKLVPLMEATLAAPLGDEKAAEMQKVMIKSLWSSIHQSVPLYMQELPIFMQWMELLYRVIEAPVPPQAQGSPTASADEKKDLGKMVFWKCKRWAAHILHRLFQKYGNPKLSEKQLGEERKGEIVISKTFHDQLANHFLQMFMHKLETLANGGFLPERLVVEATNYIMIAVTLAVTWTNLKPNCIPLIMQVLFPMLCFDDADEELWTDDPNEFIRKSNDIMEDYQSQRVGACNLIIDLCKKRTTTTLLPTLEFCVGHLKAYKEGTGNARIADGALYCIGSLASPLQEKKLAAQYEQQILWLLKDVVAPMIKTDKGHLRGRAAWMISQFVKTVMKDQPFFQAITSEMMTLLADSDLPVRFQAAVALRGLIYNPEDSAPREGIEQLVGAVFPQLLQEMFNLMDQIGSDELIATVEVLIECFAEQAAPHAENLCSRLSQHFLRLAAADDGTDDEASFAACQCCRAITTLLEAVKKTPELYAKLEPSLVPLLHTVFSPDAAGDYPFMEYMEDCLEILTYLTYYAPTISDGVWSLYKPLCQSFFDWAFDYLSNINLPLDNYISRCNDRFLAHPEHVETVYKIIERVLQTDEQSGERDCVEACKLSESLILNCMGKIDAVIPPILNLIVHRFRTNPPQKEHCRAEFLKCVANCLYYNPEGTAMALEQAGATNEIFQIWLEALRAREEEVQEGQALGNKTHFRSLHDKKVCILGLSSILRVPATSLPPTLQSGMSFIVQSIMELLQDIETEKKRKEETGGDDEDDDDDEEEGIIDVDDDCDEIDQELVKEDMDDLLAKLSQFKDGDGWDDLFGDDEDDDEYTSPIDDVDELIFFVDNFTMLQTNFPNETQALTSSFPPEGQGLLQAIVAQAPQRAAENAAKKAQEKAAG